MGAINGHFGRIGCAIIVIFALSWIVSVIIYRANRFDELEVTTEPA